MKVCIVLFAVLAATITSTASEPLPELRFGTPVNFGSPINSASFDDAAFISPNGLELFFESTRPGVSGISDLFVATRETVGAPWSSPKNLGPPINGVAIESAPYLSNDGLTMYFMSDRAGGTGGIDIWMATRHSLDAVWNEPISLDGAVNTRGADVAPIISADQLTIMFSDGAPFLNVPPRREGSVGREDIWIATRESTGAPWSAARNIGEPINSTSGDFFPEVSADGRVLIFTSNRQGGQGDMDLWMSTRASTDDPWGEPDNLGAEINTSVQDFGARFTPDGKSLLYSSLRADGRGQSDIWEVPIYRGPALQAGDSDQDLDFDQLDLVQVQIAAKYLSGQLATWGQGDWNGAPGGSPGNPPAGDGLFNQLDIVSAQQGGLYLAGTYAAIRPSGQEGDGQTSIVYSVGTGEIAVDAPAGVELTSINIDSAGGIFTGDAAQNLGGSFDNDADNNIFKATFGSSFGSLSFGNVAQAGLSEQFVLGDLTVVGSLAGGGALGDVDLVYVPEPATVVLILLGMASLVVACHGRRHKTRSFAV